MIGKPDCCGVEDVVTEAVSVAVVETELGKAMGERETPSAGLPVVGSH